MKILVCGSRDWRDLKKIRDCLSKLPPDTVIVEGEYRGADLIARKVAEELGLDVIGVPANWIRHGKKAGPIRNGRMLDLGIDRVIAFHPDIEKALGTGDCIRQAKARGIPVEVVS